jgi:hypothetical protein
MKAVNFSKSNQMADFWADLTKLAVFNEKLHKPKDGGQNETIIGTSRSTGPEMTPQPKRTGTIYSMHGTKEERKRGESAS